MTFTPLISMTLIFSILLVLGLLTYYAFLEKRDNKNKPIYKDTPRSEYDDYYDR